MSGIQELVELTRQLRDEMHLMNRLQALYGELNELAAYEFPGSKYWTWFQKSSTPNQSTTLKQGGEAQDLITEKELPSGIGFLHSLDLSASNGSLFVINKYFSAGREFILQGHLSDFWGLGFNPRIPASAGDPIVINTALDEPVGFPAQPEWKTRVSPNFNVPFNVPFKLSIKNGTMDSPGPTGASYGPPANITVYSWDLYFWMMTPRGEDLLRRAQEEKLALPPVLRVFGRAAED